MKWEQQTMNHIKASPDLDLNAIFRRGGDLSTCIKKIQDELQSKLAHFFDNSRQSDMLCQWRAITEIKLNDLAQALQNRAEKQCKLLKENLTIRAETDQVISRYDEEMTISVKKLINTLKIEQEELSKNLEQEKLTTEQLRRILDHKLLTRSQLQKYQGHNYKLLSEEQVEQIGEEEVTVERLKWILDTGILKKEQMKIILDKERLSEEELQKEFDLKWDKLIHDLPSVSESKVDVEFDIENGIKEHMGTDAGKLVEELKRSSLQERKAVLHLKVVKDYHIVRRKSDSRFREFLNRGSRLLRLQTSTITDYQVSEAQVITGNIFDSICKHLGDLEDEKYDPIFTEKLLICIDQAIDSSEQKCHSAEIVFTNEFTLDMYLTACSFALKQFERMVETFRRLNNPIVYLERERKRPLFTLFKSQYYQIAQESAVASTFCELLAKPIERQVQILLGRTVVEKMRGAHVWCRSKPALKAKILVDLGEDLQRNETKDMAKYFAYINDAKQSFEFWIRHYIQQYCDERDAEGLSKLQAIAAKEVSHMVNFVQEKVNQITSAVKAEECTEVETETWMFKFFEDVGVKKMLGSIQCGISVFEDSASQNEVKAMNVSSFNAGILEELKKLKNRLHDVFKTITPEELNTWKNSPYAILKEMIGCCKQCPFCYEICRWEENDHIKEGNDSGDNSVKHSVVQHRPNCLGGWRYKGTNLMDVNICSSLVASNKSFYPTYDSDKTHPYQKYSTIFKDWYIEPDETKNSSKYWKWFVGHYSEEIATYYGAIKPDVPDAWKRLEWEAVKKDLMTEHNFV